MEEQVLKDMKRSERKESLPVRFLYKTVPGRCLLKLAVCPGVSRIMGKYLASPVSRWMIAGYIRRHGIDMKSYEKKKYVSFNDFFIRKRKRSKCTLDVVPSHLISPCDGYLSVYSIDSGSKFRIKNVEYSIPQLLENDLLASSYLGGTCFVFRLTPQNYHRYCYIDDGLKGKNHFVKGVLHCVRPVACETYPVYVRNSREYTVIRTMFFGKVVQMEVGALLVGKIHNHQEAGEVLRGEEKGYFAFGGSTIILLLEKGRVVPNKNIRLNMLYDRETKVKMGENIAVRTH